MYKTISIGAIIGACLIPQVFADSPLKGEIRICRRPGLQGAADQQSVQIPISEPSTHTNTYTGTCDSSGDNCRNISVAVTKAGTIGPGSKSCVVLPAVLFESDGHPLQAGQHLLPQWSIPGFEPVITVVQTFR